MSQLVPIKLKDYKPPAWLVKHINLRFELTSQQTTVTSTIEFYFNPLGLDNQQNDFNIVDSLRLNGTNLQLQHLAINGQELKPQILNNGDLQLNNLPANNFTLTSKLIINPADNSSLEGLYLSNNIYCTQCEAEGFRKITYFPDRPDILTTFTTTIIADKATNPVLLSNGNLVGQRDLPNGKHLVKWHDPIPKPCYLFALVAGDLVATNDKYVTQSQQQVELNIFTEAHNQHLCAYAMQSLKQAFVWDELEYGREYDLKTFNIVAVDNFNSGAMENKGLNIFNAKYILADINSATDEDYINIQAVVGHEYFHNWTGNRITCRDWFQLSLKEGLTVFRDQQFTASFYSPAVKRINDVKLLQTLQFAEDKSPLSHPVRPEQYVAIRNFYTYTVYEKGAEIIRMFYQLLGQSAWRLAMDNYFSTFDGKAVTVEDLVQCFTDNLNNKFSASDLQLMMNWYQISGTPQLFANWQYNPQIAGFDLILSQDKELLIPVTIAWVDTEQVSPSTTLTLNSATNKYQFPKLAKTSVPSILQGFSAPVELHADYKIDEMVFLIKYDNDKFNRWQMLQQLFSKLILDDANILPEINNLLLMMVDDKDLEWQAEMLMLPSLNNLAEKMPVLDVDLLVNNYLQICQAIADNLLENLTLSPFIPSTSLLPAAMAQRKLNNNILWMLSFSSQPQIIIKRCERQFYAAQNMTDKIAALKASINVDVDLSQTLLADFKQQYQKQDLVLDKWLALQSAAIKGDVLSQISAIAANNKFQWRTPNRVYALIGGFSNNIAQFHQANGEGYKFISQWILRTDAINPQTAARLAKSFAIISKLTGKRKLLLQAEITKLSQQQLSTDVSEIIESFL